MTTEIYNDEMDLMVSLSNQPEAFTLGVEAGMFWRDIEAGKPIARRAVHAKNQECLTRIAKHFGRAMVWDEVEDASEWLIVTVLYGEPQRIRNPCVVHSQES